jgi:hypothetical protein
MHRKRLLIGGFTPAKLDPCRRPAHETHEQHENQMDAWRFILRFSPWVGEMKTGLVLPGTASFRVIRVFRGPLRLHHYG